MEKFNNLVSSAHVLAVNRAYNENDVILMKSKLNIIQKLYLQSEIPPKLRVNISEAQKDSIISAIADGHLDRNIFHGTIMSLFPVIMYFWKRFCNWKTNHSYFQYSGKKFKHRKSPKPVSKFPPGSGGKLHHDTRSLANESREGKARDRRAEGDHTTLRFSLLKGIEWLWPQQRDVVASSLQNSSSENLTQPGQSLSAMQLYPVPGQKSSCTKKEKK